MARGFLIPLRGWLCVLIFLSLEFTAFSESARRGIPNPAESWKPVWIVSNGFHSGLAIRRGDAGPLLRRSAADPAADWILVGWGDKQFFMAKKVTPWIAVQAVCWPTPSALHIVPLRQEPERSMVKSDIVRLSLDAKNFGKLRDRMEGQFARGPNGREIPLGKGFLPRSQFYLGKERFYFPKMCNFWTAEALQGSGVPIRPARAITAGQLIREAARLGKRTARRSRPVDAF